MTDRELRNRLDHIHEMLHGLATTLAEVAIAIGHHDIPKGMTPEESDAVAARLNGQAAKLNAIAAAPPTT